MFPSFKIGSLLKLFDLWQEVCLWFLQVAASGLLQIAFLNLVKMNAILQDTNSLFEFLYRICNFVLETYSCKI